MDFEDEINISIYVGRFSRKFGESFDKAWRKTAFSWKLGGLKLLTCYVSFPGGQEAGEPLVSVWKCQTWPEKVSKGHREKQNTTCECAAAAEWVLMVAQTLRCPLSSSCFLPEISTYNPT